MGLQELTARTSVERAVCCARAPCCADEAKQVPPLTSTFGLPMDTTHNLLGFLQVRTLCRLRMISRGCLSLVTPRSKKLVSSFCYTPESMDTSMFTKKIQAEASQRRRGHGSVL